MKSFVVGIVAVLALSSSAYAQPSTSESSGYLEFVAQSSSGDVTSQSFGVEGGWSLTPRITVFAEFGSIRDTAPATIGPAAQLIAAYLATVQSSTVSYSVKQPVTFGQAGIKYLIPLKNQIHAYALGGGGIARVKRDVRFVVGGNDVTDTLPTYGVVLGTDLGGTESNPIATVGAGITWQPKGMLLIDLGYRFSRILTAASGTNVNRIGIGIGVTF